MNERTFTVNIDDLEDVPLVPSQLAISGTAVATLLSIHEDETTGTAVARYGTTVEVDEELELMFTTIAIAEIRLARILGAE